MHVQNPPQKKLWVSPYHLLLNSSEKNGVFCHGNEFFILKTKRLYMKTKWMIRISPPLSFSKIIGLQWIQFDTLLEQLEKTFLEKIQIFSKYSQVSHKNHVRKDTGWLREVLKESLGLKRSDCANTNPKALSWVNGYTDQYPIICSQECLASYTMSTRKCVINITAVLALGNRPGLQTGLRKYFPQWSPVSSLCEPLEDTYVCTLWTQDFLTLFVIIFWSPNYMWM